MKRLALLSLLCAVMLSLASCDLINKPSDNDAVEGVELTEASQVDGLLHNLQGELYALSMMDNDICDNADAIINTHSRISKIIKAIEENPELLTAEQQERFQTLREEYRAKTGE